MQENRLTAVCEKGNIQIIPYADNVIQFIYTPIGGDGEIISPMWGIEARPDSNVHVSFDKDNLETYFGISGIRTVLHENGSVSFNDASGRELLTLLDYSLESAVVLGESTYHIRAEFSASEDERYFGLGQHQDGKLNLGKREQILWHDYSHKGGEIVAVPFMVTNKRYGIVFDNPSRMKVTPGIEGHTAWQAEVGEEISFFLITGKETNDIYKGFRLLTGVTPPSAQKRFGIYPV